MKRKQGSALIWAGVVMILSSLCLTAYNIHEANRAKETSEQILEQLLLMVPTQPPVEEVPLVTEPPAHPDEVEIPDYILNPKMDMPEKEIDGRYYIGVLEVPSQDLSLPVIGRWSMDDVRVAPCRYEGSAYLKNLIIAAHNYNGHFGQIKELRVRDQVRFTDMDGNLFLYQVVEQETLMPTAIQEMSAGEWDLTLFTCTVGGAYRVTIRCELIMENGQYPNQELFQ